MLPDGEHSAFIQTETIDKSVVSILSEVFDSQKYDKLQIMVATVSSSGVSDIETQLREFCNQEGELEILVGTDIGLDTEGVRKLMRIQSDYPGSVSLQFVEQTGDGIFHPKVYQFTNNNEGVLVAGSPNWSRRGHSDNTESVFVSNFDIDQESLQPSNVSGMFEQLYQIADKSESNIQLVNVTEEVVSQLESSSTETTTRNTPNISVSDIDDESEGSSLWPLRRSSSELVMTLLKESRTTQLCPTKEIWKKYFGVDVDFASLDNNEELDMVFDLEYIDAEEPDEVPVVVHDHQGTLEIGELANRNNPGHDNDYIIFRRLGGLHYEYELFLEQDSDPVDEIEQFLSTNGFKTGNKRHAYIS
jgi:HKD family nuclease